MSSPLSPPEGTSEKLDNLSSSAAAIIAGLDDILKIPYVDGFQADEVGKVSVEDAVQDLKEKYQALQANILPFARDLYGYAGLQVQIIPLIGSSLSLETCILLNKSIIARKKLRAAHVKQESETFRKQFLVSLDLFESAISSLGEQIDDLSNSIQSNQDAYDTATASGVISGILAGILTTAAILGMAATSGALAGAAGAGTSSSAAIFRDALKAVGGIPGVIGGTSKLPTGSLASLTTTIVTSIEAEDYLRAISAMESLKSSAITARNELSEVVKKMDKIEDSLDAIVTVWTDVESSLGIILRDVAEWEKTSFSQELSAATIKEWTDVRTSVQKYTLIVSEGRVVYWAAANKDLLSIAKLMSRVRVMAALQLKLGVDAPEVDFNGKLSDLSVAKSALKAARGVSGGSNKLSPQIDTAERNLVDAEKGMTVSALNLRDLSMRSVKFFSELRGAGQEAKAKDLLRYVVSVRAELEKGLNEATNAEKSAFTFQTSIGIVNNTLLRTIAEKKAQQDHLRRRLRSVEKARRKRKWLWLVPLAGAINELIDLAKDIKGDINKLRREISRLARMRADMLNASEKVGRAVKDCTLIVQAYSTVLNKSQVTLDNAHLIHALEMEVPPQIVESAERSWSELDDDLSDFLG